MEQKQLSQEQIQKLQNLKNEQSQKIIRDLNSIYIIYKGYRYTLALSKYQFDRFLKDFSLDNYTYDFTFWIKALFTFGVSFPINDNPE